MHLRRLRELAIEMGDGPTPTPRQTRADRVKEVRLDEGWAPWAEHTQMNHG